MGVPLNIDFKQILLHLFNFIVLFTCLYYLLYKPVKNFMDKRKAYYEEKDNEINANLNEAESLKKEYAEKVSAFEKESKKKLEQASKEIDALKKEELDKAKLQAKEIVSNAKLEGEREKQMIIDKSGKEISEMVASALEKVNTEESFDEFLNMTKGK